MELIKLLENRNRCLRKFLEGTKSFLLLCEYDETPDLQGLHSLREAMIKALQSYDSKVTESIKKMQPSEKSTQLIEMVRSLVLDQDELVKQILMTDKQIIEKIEIEKTKLMKELTESERQKEIVKKFKSTWIPESGEKLDGTL